jgi:hypothetical protein
MTGSSSHAASGKSGIWRIPRTFLARSFAWFVTAFWFMFRFLLVAWAGLAIYYSDLPWAALRLGLGLTFSAFAAWVLWRPRGRRMLAILAILYVGLVAWWLSIAPSHDRHWRPEVAVMPRAFIDGDRVRITGVRNFDYRSEDDFTIRHETREVRLSQLTGIDFYLSFWAEGPVGHTFLSFLFEDAPPLTISIETRPEVGESFDPIGSLFKQFELIYVVGDERDIVGVRTSHRDEQVYLYRLNTSPEDARRLLMVYVERINQLADRPEFYHLLSNSCTMNIARYANAAGRTGGFDFRHLLNGLVDAYLYRSGRVDTTLPFVELRRRSLINEEARAAEDLPDFSHRIRAALVSPPMAPR